LNITVERREMLVKQLAGDPFFIVFVTEVRGREGARQDRQYDGRGIEDVSALTRGCDSAASRGT
jgi:hypothetical protein